jgi:hypothetical protein
MSYKIQSHLRKPKHCDLLTLPVPMIFRDGCALVSSSKSRAYLKQLCWPFWKGKEIQTWTT